MKSVSKLRSAEVEEGELCSDSESTLNKETLESPHSLQTGCGELQAFAGECRAQEGLSRAGALHTSATGSPADSQSAAAPIPAATNAKRKRERRRRRNRRSNPNGEQQQQQVEAAEEGGAGAEPAAKRVCLGEYGSDEELDRSSTDGEEVVLEEHVLGPPLPGRIGDDEPLPMFPVDCSDPLGLSSCVGESFCNASDNGLQRVCPFAGAQPPSTSNALAEFAGAGATGVPGDAEGPQSQNAVQVIKERYTLVGKL